MRFVELSRWLLVKAPITFLEEEMEILSRYAVEESQITLRLIPEILDTADMVPGFNEHLRVMDAVITVPSNI